MRSTGGSIRSRLCRAPIGGTPINSSAVSTRELLSAGCDAIFPREPLNTAVLSERNDILVPWQKCKFYKNDRVAGNTQYTQQNVILPLCAQRENFIIEIYYKIWQPQEDRYSLQQYFRFICATCILETEMCCWPNVCSEI